MAILKVAIVGATGETGSSIVNGLLRSTEPRYVSSLRNFRTYLGI
jgi:aspartate-semialdehyde dehydrogenase